MLDNHRLSWLGIGVIAFGILLLTVAIPNAVTTPSNVQAIVLSPTFWPVIVAWLIIGLGALLVLLQALSPSTDDAATSPTTNTSGAWARLVAAAVLMIALVYVIPIVGMVWTTMACFILLSVIIRTPRPILSLAVALVLPLVLYAFFNHIAGVAVPQGEFIRLP